MRTKMLRSITVGLSAVMMMGMTLSVNAFTGSIKGSDLGKSYKDTPVVPDSWTVTKEIVTYEDDELVYSTYAVCGFKDGVFSNSDTIQIPRVNGMAHGLVAQCRVTCGSNDSKWSGYGSGKSDKMSVKHSGLNDGSSVEYWVDVK